MKKFKIKSFCKVNLSLRIINKLKNHYHNISSFITFADLHDVISVEKIRGLKDIISFSGRFKKGINKRSNTITKVLYLLRKKKFFKKIYIDRSDSKFNLSKKRQIINEDIIKNTLIKKKFKIVKLSEFKFVDQIALFNSAKIIVGNHGAGFANLVFCKKNTKIIEFVDKNTSQPIKKISKDLNLKYFSIMGKRIGKNKKDQNNNIEISIKKLIKKLN